MLCLQALVAGPSPVRLGVPPHALAVPLLQAMSDARVAHEGAHMAHMRATVQHLQQMGPLPAPHSSRDCAAVQVHGLRALGDLLRAPAAHGVPPPPPGLHAEVCAASAFVLAYVDESQHGMDAEVRSGNMIIFNPRQQC